MTETATNTTDPLPRAQTNFADRHIGSSVSARNEMLAAIGLASIDELIVSALPRQIIDNSQQSLRAPLREDQAIDRLRELANRNKTLISLIGLGYYNTRTPTVIQRNILENPAWYTAYTPYQPEISQGRLEALLNFQTMISDLTGREIANASLLDEATAAAEAMALLHRQHGGHADTFLIDQDCLPQTIAVLQTRAKPLGLKILVGDPNTAATRDTFGVLYQYPGASGQVRNLRAGIEAHHKAGRLVATAADLLALCLLTPPGEMGADVVVGVAQRFGVPVGFGGPHAGYIAVRESYKRSLPGRLVGVSVDEHGRSALRLALQTREQHIRRERATSNICTAQVLLAVTAGAFAVYHGPDGLRQIASRVHGHTTVLAQGLRSAGIEIENSQWFDTLTVQVPGSAKQIIETALADGMNLRYIDVDRVAVSLDETVDGALVERILEAFGAKSSNTEPKSPLPPDLVRQTEFLTHPVFHSYRSETEMLRYLRKLVDRDLALDRTMIPLGSCTMKLNATTEMLPVTWPEFSSIHPFVPADQSVGYRELIAELEDALCQITGYTAVSLQPNAGSQGEFAGLLAIRAYHQSRNDENRIVCLIPSSAHGTNAASAAMAGMEVVVVACDDSGNVDLSDLKNKCTEHSDRLAALMVTYPSTHGVFEDNITEICELVHSHGCQVYLDGANLNAMVGLAKPGHFGADVSHLNLHKTFCIPHGGGGPGVGPIAVAEHLTPFLPNHPIVDAAGPTTGIGPVSGAPWGSAGVLPISWAYIAMMGHDGLVAATKAAILAANYIAKRLDPYFPVLFSGQAGFVAHECILDLRSITKDTGVTVEDVAKRLIDYGFHAPTVSFPVHGTLMVEPTESESLEEINRFCHAMIAIKNEINLVANGDWAIEDSPLRHAPHTASDLMADTWNAVYPRSVAKPSPIDAPTSPDTYWPPVSRIDGAYGDKNLACSCPPLSSY